MASDYLVIQNQPVQVSVTQTAPPSFVITVPQPLTLTVGTEGIQGAVGPAPTLAGAVNVSNLIPGAAATASFTGGPNTYTLNLGVPVGSQILQGSGVPAGATGVQGYWYIDTASYNMYEKTAVSTWTNRLNIRGATGPSPTFSGTVPVTVIGSTVNPTASITGVNPYTLNLSLPAAPQQYYGDDATRTSGLGLQGDAYTVTTGATNLGNVYKKTSSTVWTLQGNIRGAAGTGNVSSGSAVIGNLVTYGAADGSTITDSGWSLASITKHDYWSSGAGGSNSTVAYDLVNFKSPNPNAGGDTIMVDTNIPYPASNVMTQINIVGHVHGAANSNLDVTVDFYNQITPTISSPNWSNNGTFPVASVAIYQNAAGKIAIGLTATASAPSYVSVMVPMAELTHGVGPVQSWFQGWTASVTTSLAAYTLLATATLSYMQNTVNLAGNQSIAGNKTFTGPVALNAGAQALSLGTSASDNVFMGYYARVATPATRSAYTGFGSAASTDFRIVNEISAGTITVATTGNGTIALNAGTGNITATGTLNGTVAVQDGGQRVYSPNNIPSASIFTTGTIPVARLGSGGTASGATFLRGDNTWSSVISNLAAANDTRYLAWSINGGTDGTLGPQNLYMGVFPSATASSRYAFIYSGDSLSVRPLVLNTTATGAFGQVAIGTVTPNASSLNAVPYTTAARGITITGKGFTQTVTNKELTSNVATLTTSVAHGFVTGKQVVVSGVDATFNGTYTVASTPTSTTFTYAKVAADVVSVAATGVALGDAQTGDLLRLETGVNAGVMTVNAVGAVSMQQGLTVIGTTTSTSLTATGTATAATFVATSSGARLATFTHTSNTADGILLTGVSSSPRLFFQNGSETALANAIYRGASQLIITTGGTPGTASGTGTFFFSDSGHFSATTLGGGGANITGVVHTTGTESVAGVKTFTNNPVVQGTGTATTVGQLPVQLVLQTSTGTATSGSELLFRGTTLATDVLTSNYASISTSMTSNGVTGSVGNIIFSTKTAVGDTTLTERLRISSSGLTTAQALTVTGTTTLSTTNVTGTVTATTFSGSGASLTSLPAGQLTGTAPIGVIPTGTSGTTVALGNHGHALTDANITGILPIAQIPTGTSGTTVALGNHVHAAADVTSGVFAQARVAPNMQRFLFTTGSEARPTGTTYVQWVGPVTPVNAIDGDAWEVTP